MFQIDVRLRFRAEVPVIPKPDPNDKRMQVIDLDTCRRVYYDLSARKAISHELPPVLGATLVIDEGEVTIDEVTIHESSYSIRVTAKGTENVAKILGEPSSHELERLQYYETMMEVCEMTSPKNWTVTVGHAPFLYAAS